MERARCNTLIKSLQPIFTTSKCLGFAPWNIALIYNQHKYVSLQFQTTKCNVTYTWCLFTLISAQFIQSLYWKIIYKAAFMSAPFLISHFLHGSLYSLTDLILLGLSPRRTMKNIERILMSVVQIDETLQISAATYRKMNTYIKFLLFFSFTILIFFIIMDAFVQKLTDRFLHNDIARDTAFLIIIGGEMQFLVFIAILGHRFFTVNKQIEIVLSGKHVHQNMFLKMETKSKQMACFKIKLNHKENQEDIRRLHHEKFHTILQLHKCHQQLIDSCELLMSTFGPFLCSLMTFHFVTGLLCIYSFITPHNDNFMVNPGVALGWGGLCGISIMIVIGVCQWTVNEANKTPKLISSTLLQYSLEYGNIQNLLLFPMQLFHSNLSLSVCGFFNMNFSMLLTFFGSFATYLVIMVQYDLSIKDQ